MCPWSRLAVDLVICSIACLLACSRVRLPRVLLSAARSTYIRYRLCCVPGTGVLGVLYRRSRSTEQYGRLPVPGTGSPLLYVRVPVVASGQQAGTRALSIQRMTRSVMPRRSAGAVISEGYTDGTAHVLDWTVHCAPLSKAKQTSSLIGMIVSERFFFVIGRTRHHPLYAAANAVCLNIVLHRN